MGNKYYKVTLKPLQAYHFATENNFWSKKRNKEASVPYYVTSDRMPTQTTILGTLRYLVLKQTGKLGNKASNEERASLIGPETFSYDASLQTFGAIQSLTSIFLEKNGEQYIVKPANLKNATEKSLSYYEVVENEEKNRYLKDFSAKHYATGEFISLDNQEIVDDLFSVKVKTRINKAKKNKTNQDDDAFFKVEMVQLKKDTHFAFFAVFSEDFVPKNDIVFMGSYQTGFAIQFKEVDENASEQFFATIRQVLSKETSQPFYYAFSDVLVTEKNTEVIRYAISQKRHFRNLKTEFKGGKRYITAGGPGELYIAGSVFYMNENAFLNEQLQQIGLNKLIKIGE